MRIILSGAAARTGSLKERNKIECWKIEKIGGFNKGQSKLKNEYHESKHGE